MNPEKIIEALIFVADAPLKPRQILEIWEGEEFQDIPMTEELLLPILEGLLEKFRSDLFIFELRQIDGGYQFFTKREYFPYARHAAMVKSKRRLSRSTLETLSVVAYRQPISKAEVEFIRGVNCDHALAKLLDKKLVEIGGRATTAGRPLLYKTTGYFMEYFGINDLGDLPRMDEFGMTEEQYQMQFRTFLEDRELEEAVKSGEINEDEAVMLREMRESGEPIPMPEKLRRENESNAGEVNPESSDILQDTEGEGTPHPGDDIPLTGHIEAEPAEEFDGTFQLPEDGAPADAGADEEGPVAGEEEIEASEDGSAEEEG